MFFVADQVRLKIAGTAIVKLLKKYGVVTMLGVKVMVGTFGHTKNLVGSWWDLGGNHKLGEIQQ